MLKAQSNGHLLHSSLTLPGMGYLLFVNGLGMKISSRRRIIGANGRNIPGIQQLHEIEKES